MIRSFIALDLPAEIREALGKLQLRLKEAKAPVNWVKPDRIHLTLKFLGDVQEDVLPEIMGALEKVASQTEPFSLRPEGCGAFPSMMRMRVVWVGLIGEQGALADLRQKTEDAVAALGFPREDRPFKPHLTLGRVRDARHIKELQQGLLNSRAFVAEAFDVTEVVLYKSDLRSEGAHYTPLCRARLGMRAHEGF